MSARPGRSVGSFRGHVVRTLLEMGWDGLKNGALLARAGAEFDVLLTADANMEFQQNLANLPISIIVLVAYSNDVNALRPLMGAVRDLLPIIEPGRLYRIGPTS